MRRLLKLALIGFLLATGGCRLGADILWNALLGVEEPYYEFNGDGQYLGTSNRQHDTYLEAQRNAFNVPPAASERTQWEAFQRRHEAEQWVEENRYY